MPARIGNITFDCHDVLTVAAFWSAVLGRPIDKGSSELFASIGGADGTRQEPAWYFNKVPEPKQAKNRVHIDLVNPDPAAIDELRAAWRHGRWQSQGAGTSLDRAAGPGGQRVLHRSQKLHRLGLSARRPGPGMVRFAAVCCAKCRTSIM